MYVNVPAILLALCMLSLQPFWLVTKKSCRLRLSAAEKRQDSPVWAQLRNWAADVNVPAHSLHLGSSQAGFDALRFAYDRIGQPSLREVFVDSSFHGIILGVMLVRIEILADGPLGRLTAEQRFSWDIHGRCSMICLSVEVVVPLQDAQPWVAAQPSKNPQTCFRLHPGIEANLWGLLASGTDMTMREMLDSYGYEIDHDKIGLAFQVLPPIAMAVVAGQWDDVSIAVVSTRFSKTWPQDFRAAMQQDTAFDGRPLDDRVAPIDLTDPLVLHKLAEDLRQVANALGSPDTDHAWESLEGWAAILDRQSICMRSMNSSPHIEYFQSRGGGSQRYNIVFLIRCLTVCTDLRSDVHLQRVLRGALRILFPGPVAAYFIDILGDKSFGVPSTAVLSQMRFVLDMGLMLNHRIKLAAVVNDTLELDVGAPLFYHMYDSSPQGGMNWLMSHYDMVEGSDVQSVGEALFSLLDMSVNFNGGERTPQLMQRERSAVLTLACKIQRHDNIPVGLGSGRAALVYEVHAFYHSLYMETGDVPLLSAAYVFQHSFIDTSARLIVLGHVHTSSSSTLAAIVVAIAVWDVYVCPCRHRVAVVVVALIDVVFRDGIDTVLANIVDC
jgi:hypothetical protein